MKLVMAKAAIFVVVLGLPLAGETDAVAEQSAAVCSFTFDNGTVSPGVTMRRASEYWKAGLGPIDCTGSIVGKQITGTGVIEASGMLERT